MADSTHGRLFTLGEVSKIANLARLEGAPTTDQIIRELEAQEPFTVPADEPAYLLRGNNRAHSTALAFLSELLEHRGAEDESAEVVAASNEMHVWQAANPDRVERVPDTEEGSHR